MPLRAAKREVVVPDSFDFHDTLVHDMGVSQLPHPGSCLVVDRVVCVELLVCPNDCGVFGLSIDIHRTVSVRGDEVEVGVKLHFGTVSRIRHAQSRGVCVSIHHDTVPPRGTPYTASAGGCSPYLLTDLVWGVGGASVPAGMGDRVVQDPPDHQGESERLQSTHGVDYSSLTVRGGILTGMPFSPSIPSRGIV